MQFCGACGTKKFWACGACNFDENPSCMAHFCGMCGSANEQHAPVAAVVNKEQKDEVDLEYELCTDSEHSFY